MTRFSLCCAVHYYAALRRGLPHEDALAVGYLMGTPYKRYFCESCARRYGLPSKEEAPDQWEYAVRTRYHCVYD
jgi:hypothetical protein